MTPPEAKKVDRSFVQGTNAYLLDYIKFGDAKAGAILTLTIAAAGGAASTGPKALESAKTVGLGASLFTLALLAAVLVFALLVVRACVHALRPRVDSAKSLHSFPDIASMSLDAYVDAVRALPEESISVQYCRHNWTLASVATAKFAEIARATTLLGWMLLFEASYAAATGIWALLFT